MRKPRQGRGIVNRRSIEAADIAKLSAAIRRSIRRFAAPQKVKGLAKGEAIELPLTLSRAEQLAPAMVYHCLIRRVCSHGLTVKAGGRYSVFAEGSEIGKIIPIARCLMDRGSLVGDVPKALISQSPLTQELLCYQV
jgi:hypothetical protein